MTDLDLSGYPEPPTRRELADAWQMHHMQSFVDMMVFCLGAAAQQQPEKLRQALKDVFSSEAVEGMAKRAFWCATEAQKAAREAATQTQMLLEQVTKTLDEVENRLDVAEARQDNLKGRAAG